MTLSTTVSHAAASLSIGDGGDAEVAVLSAAAETPPAPVTRFCAIHEAKRVERAPPRKAVHPCSLAAVAGERPAHQPSSERRHLACQSFQIQRRSPPTASA